MQCPKHLRWQPVCARSKPANSASTALDVEDAQTILRALKALAPCAVVLLSLVTCRAQGPRAQQHDVMRQLSQAFERVVTRVAAGTGTLGVVVSGRPHGAL